MAAKGSALDNEVDLCKLPCFIPSAEKHCQCMTLNPTEEGGSRKATITETYTYLVERLPHRTNPVKP